MRKDDRPAGICRRADGSCAEGATNRTWHLNCPGAKHGQNTPNDQKDKLAISSGLIAPRTRTPLSPATTMILWRIAVNWSQAPGISDDPDRRSHGTSSTRRAGSRPAALRNRPSALFQAGWTEMRFRPIPGKQAAPVRSCETALGQSLEQSVLIAAERPAGDRDRAFFSR